MRHCYEKPHLRSEKGISCHEIHHTKNERRKSSTSTVFHPYPVRNLKSGPTGKNTLGKHENSDTRRRCCQSDGYKPRQHLLVGRTHGLVCWHILQVLTLRLSIIYSRCGRQSCGRLVLHANLEKSETGKCVFRMRIFLTVRTVALSLWFLFPTKDFYGWEHIYLSLIAYHVSPLCNCCFHVFTLAASSSLAASYPPPPPKRQSTQTLHSIPNLGRLNHANFRVL